MTHKEEPVATLTTDGSDLADSDREKLRVIVSGFGKRMRMGTQGGDSYQLLLNQVEVRSGCIRITCWYRNDADVEFGQLTDWALPQRFNISLNA